MGKKFNEHLKNNLIIKKIKKFKVIKNSKKNNKNNNFEIFINNNSNDDSLTQNNSSKNKNFIFSSENINNKSFSSYNKSHFSFSSDEEKQSKNSQNINSNINKKIPSYTPILCKGSGAFGNVIIVKDNYTDLTYAIKRKHKVSKIASREYHILSMLKNSNNKYSTKFKEIFFTKHYYVEDNNNNNKEKPSKNKPQCLIIQNIVQETIPDNLESILSDHYNKKNYFPISYIKKLMKEMLLGIQSIHDLGIVHRDLKPENTLITLNNKVKFCDFGNSKFFNSSIPYHSMPQQVTRYYRAPELILGCTNYTEKIDIFSLGAIFAELFILFPIFPGSTEGLQIFEEIFVLGGIPEKFLDKYKVPDVIKKILVKLKGLKKADFGKILNKSGIYCERDIDDASFIIEKMLSIDPKERPSAKDCLKFDFFVKNRGKIIGKKNSKKIMNLKEL